METKNYLVQVTSKEMVSYVGKACSAPLQSPHVEALHRLLKFEYFRSAYHRVLSLDFEVSAMDRPVKELRRDRHTVSLLTDHLVITQSIAGKSLPASFRCRGGYQRDLR